MEVRIIHTPGSQGQGRPSDLECAATLMMPVPWFGRALLKPRPGLLDRQGPLIL
jgi:hypothetical protein